MQDMIEEFMEALTKGAKPEQSEQSLPAMKNNLVLSKPYLENEVIQRLTKTIALHMDEQSTDAVIH